MTKSKVYFMNARASGFGDSLIDKTYVLFEEAGFGAYIRQGDVVAVKTHMGVGLGTRYLRPNIVRAVVDKVKESGGEPFVTDTTTLSSGPWFSRDTALEYLKIAARNGYTQESMNAPIVIADGWLGDDDICVEVDGNDLKLQYVAKAIATADAMIVMSHITGTELGFAGAIKKAGAGCISKRGKFLLHGAPTQTLEVRKERCVGKKCEWSHLCESACPRGGLKILPDTVEFDKKKCILCYACFYVCNKLARRRVFHVLGEGVAEFTALRLADSVAAVMSRFDKNKVGFLSYLVDVTPECDCMEWSDVPIVPDIGILASKDIVAIDAAALDLIKNAPGIPGSRVQKKNAMQPGIEKFSALFDKDVYLPLKSCEKVGLGTMDYELVPVKPRVVKYSTVGSRYLKRAYAVGHPSDKEMYSKPSKFFKSVKA